MMVVFLYTDCEPGRAISPFLSLMGFGTVKALLHRESDYVTLTAADHFNERKSVNGEGTRLNLLQQGFPLRYHRSWFRLTAAECAYSPLITFH
jgi:hypothetical protein